MLSDRPSRQFLIALLNHADLRALTSSLYNPRVLAANTILPRLYNPDRVRRRDLVQKCDAFHLFRDLRNHVARQKTADEAEQMEV